MNKVNYPVTISLTCLNCVHNSGWLETGSDYCLYKCHKLISYVQETFCHKLYFILCVKTWCEMQKK